MYGEVVRAGIEKWIKAKEDSASVSAAEAVLSQMTMGTEDSMETREVEIHKLSISTGMSRELSLQCLEECGWDMNLAMEAFGRVRDAGLLPS